MSVIFKAIGSLLGIGGSPALPTPQPVAQRDDAQAAANDQDALRQRRGAAADILTGTAGAEAGAGVKFVAGS